MRKLLILGILFAACGLAQAQCGAGGVGAYGGVGAFQCGLGVVVIGLENTYCPKGVAPDYTEQISPLWGATDDLATLPTKCMYTGLDATPSPGNIYTPASSATLTNILTSICNPNCGTGVNADGTTVGASHFTCGDTIILNAGSSYTGSTGAPWVPFTFPALPCDGLHWITVKSSGVSNPLFPGEGVRATPCIMGLSNDASNGRQSPGYPDYPCASFPTVLSAKILQPANDLAAAISFASGASHYRFIGIEVSKNPANKVQQIVQLEVDSQTMGANHIIFDRSVIHGDPWTPTAGKVNESQNGVDANNSQWVALINSWDYDTYCLSSCIDSHGFSGGTGLYQDGPFKLYNNLLATAAEPFIFGGGGHGPGTPNSANLEARSNHLMKPLTWMVPVNVCPFYYDPVTKNLSEFKNMTLALVEGNFFENSWQGCQSDQTGYAMLLDPVSQNTHQGMTVTFDGTQVATTTGNFTHDTNSSLMSGNPADAANCPPGGCILQDTINNVNYRFCNSANGCDQNGIPNRKCGTGANAGLSCTTDGQCPGSYCAPTTSARLTKTTIAGTVAANSCVPGLCPSCKNQDITFRFNEIYNVTNGLEVNAGLSSVCQDQASGMSRMSLHDNHIHGLSREMSNGKTAFQGSTAFILSNSNLPPGVMSTVAVRHNTVAVEAGSQIGVSGFGNQVDHTDSQYMQGIAITNNVAPGSYSISHTQGSNVSKGIGGLGGLANTYAVNSCQRYFTTEVPDGTVGAAPVPPPPVWPPQDFTFAGLPSGGTNYLINYNGQWTAITLQAATSFHITATVKVGDTINVRDLNDCDWTFASNLLGAGVSGQTGTPYGSPGLSPNFFGSGQSQSPYPNQNTDTSKPQTCGSGGTGNTLNCILDESALQGVFTNNFVSWLTGRNGIYSIANGSPFQTWASDQASRTPSGTAPGVDFVTLAAKMAGVRGTTFMPPLTVTTTSLGATAGQAYNAQLVASAGASQFWNGYKSWWIETLNAACTPSSLTPACGSTNNGTAHSGIVIARSGIVNGPIPILTVSRTGCPSACLSNYSVNSTITGGAWEVGQTASLAQFVDAGGTGANNQDGQFNGVCVITVAPVSTNNFSCQQSGDIAGTNGNKPSHSPNGPTGTPLCGVNTNSQCDSVVSFAPITAGTYSFWVGARDGAFQVARGQVTVTVAAGGPPPPQTYRPTVFDDTGGATPVSSGASAFDGNSATFAQDTMVNDAVNGATNYVVIYKGFPSLSGSPTTLKLNIDNSASGTGSQSNSANASYSLNAGATWTTLWLAVPHNRTIDVVNLSPTQDITKVWVRFQGLGCFPASCTVTGNFYEISIAATF